MNKQLVFLDDYIDFLAKLTSQKFYLVSMEPYLYVDVVQYQKVYLSDESALLILTTSKLECYWSLLLLLFKNMQTWCTF